MFIEFKAAIFLAAIIFVSGFTTGICVLAYEQQRRKKWYKKKLK